MKEIAIRDEYIKLGQALKLAGFVESGADAKEAVTGGRVKVNGQVETRRGKKLVNGDTVSFEGNSLTVKAKGGNEVIP